MPALTILEKADELRRLGYTVDDTVHRRTTGKTFFTSTEPISMSSSWISF